MTTLRKTEFALATPPHFDFWRTVLSHGWCVLPPFFCDRSTKALMRVHMLSNGSFAITRIAAANPKELRIEAASGKKLRASDLAEIAQQIRHCLRLDENFSEFYQALRIDPRFRWVERVGTGRMLRSPSVFEDVAKMILTTNCTWTQTVAMVTRLVENFGRRLDENCVAFPTPESMACVSARQLDRKIRAGYRSAYLSELAKRVASGKLDLESWSRPGISTEELYRKLRGIKGVGPYAASNLLKLLGHYDYLGLDSWCRKKFSQLHAHGRKCSDKKIEKYYEKFGRWRGLALWMDLTREWHDEKTPNDPL